MKNILITTISIVSVLLIMVVGFAPARSYSVRRSIDSTEDHYKWEQWCYHESLVGFRSSERVGKFELIGKNITADSILQTDVCN